MYVWNYLNQIAVVDLAASNVVERIDVGITLVRCACFAG